MLGLGLGLGLLHVHYCNFLRALHLTIIFAVGEVNIKVFIHCYYMPLSHEDWELQNSRI